MNNIGSTLGSTLRTRFPPCVAAFGYGSGVIKQAPKRTGAEQIDLVLAVEDSEAWHRENVRRNPKDYSVVPRMLMSAKCVAWTQRTGGGKVWFNPLVKCKLEDDTQAVLKYGVVDRKDLLKDLCEWDNLYLAGRLHKPVLTLVTSPEIQLAVNKNRKAALCASIISLDRPKFSSLDLFQTIVGLSYSGDVRVGLAESPTKIKDIVLGAYDKFKDIYIYSDDARMVVTQERNVSVMTAVNGTSYLQTKSNIDENELALSCLLSTEELADQLPGHLRGARDAVTLRRRLNAIVRKSSAAQSLKGVLTAGPSKSVTYVCAKIAKRWK